MISPPLRPIGVQTEINDRGLLLCLYILDRISGEHRPLVPGLFERATELHFKAKGE